MFFGDKYNKQKGFTIIELLVVLALTATVSAFGVISLTNQKRSRDLESALQDFSSVLRDTQRRSITQQDGLRWNVRATNNVGSGDVYELFTGTSYSTSSVRESYQLRNGISFSQPFSGTTTDIFFSPVSGKTTGERSLSLVTKTADGLVGDIIIDSLGRTDSRFNTGVVGYWHFDEGASTTAYDASGFGGGGTLSGPPTWSSGSNCKSGACLSFGGGQDYVKIVHSNSLNVGNNFSVTAWAKPTALSGSQEIVIKWASGNYWFLRWSGTSLQFTPNADEASARVDYTGGTVGGWNHVAGTYDGAIGKLYLNGVLVASKSYSGGTNQNSGNLGIGAIPDGTPAQFFGGLLDEVRVYGRTLSASDVADLYEDFK